MTGQYDGDPRIEFTVKELLLKIDDRLDAYDQRISKLERLAAVATAFATTSLALVGVLAWGSLKI